MIIFEILKSFQDPETVSLMRLYQFTDKFIDSMKHIENLVSMFPQQLNLDLITFRGGLWFRIWEKKNLEKLIFKLFDPLSLQNTNTKTKISKTFQIDKTEKFECPIQIFSTDQINSHIIHIRYVTWMEWNRKVWILTSYNKKYLCLLTF